MQRGKTLGDIIQEIERRLEADHYEEGLAVFAAREHRSQETIGFVLCYRPLQDDYVTWLWNSEYNPTALFDGHYDMTYEEALMDFEARR